MIKEQLKKLGSKKVLLIAVGAAGLFLLWRRMKGSSVDPSVPPPVAKNPVKAPQAPKSPAPDLKGPAVRAGVEAATRSKICITAKMRGMIYAPITGLDSQGYQKFMPPVNGRYTRRLLCVGGQRWAEIKPA